MGKYDLSANLYSHWMKRFMAWYLASSNLIHGYIAFVFVSMEGIYFSFSCQVEGFSAWADLIAWFFYH